MNESSYPPCPFSSFRIPSNMLPNWCLSMLLDVTCQVRSSHKTSWNQISWQESSARQHEGCYLWPGEAVLLRAAISKAAEPSLARNVQRHKHEQIEGSDLTDILDFTYVIMMVQEFPGAPALSGVRHPSASGHGVSWRASCWNLKLSKYEIQ